MTVLFVIHYLPQNVDEILRETFSNISKGRVKIQERTRCRHFKIYVCFVHNNPEAEAQRS